MAFGRFSTKPRNIEGPNEESNLSIVHDMHSISPPSHDKGGQSLPVAISKPLDTLARSTSHTTSRSIRDPGPPPDGGLLAWTQIFCAWLAIMNSWGFANSFGAFQPYYESILPESASTISWIGSIQACLMFALGMFGGRALDRGWFRPTIAIGIAIQILGIFALSGAKSYWQFLLTQGFCTGVGGGIFFVPIMGLCSTYFSTHRGMALGIVTSGNSVGGIIYPLVVRQSLVKLGFGWTVRILGFINVASLLVVIALMRPRLPPRKVGPLFELEAFRDTPYCLHVLGSCFLMPPVYCVFYYIASFARDTLSMPYTASLSLVMILNGVGVPARVLPGFIADRFIGVLNVLILCLIGNTIIIFCWLSVTSINAYYAWTVLYGLFSAAFQSLFPTTIAAYSSDISKTGTRLGMAFTAIGLSALVGGPISGALLAAGGGEYRVPIVWAGASTVVGTVLCVVARCLKFGWEMRVRC
ncbi:major facilitator superfamily domain-containing protein [Phaeosphaeriaceae sp. PMI808]|nr:major facilitator superfamily domain-containing protein [Phaeosphaeriaceae sp. PMI808]